MKMTKMRLFSALLALLLCRSIPSCSAQSVLEVCPDELGDVALCLAQTSDISLIQECVNCVGSEFEQGLSSVTSCETFGDWYCQSLAECAAFCGEGCAAEALALAVCILTEGGRTPPSGDCFVGCINTTITAPPDGGPTQPPSPSAPPPPAESGITACSPEGISRCNETFQVCYNDTATGAETCGNCINRYVEFPPPTTTTTTQQADETPPPCVRIEELPWEDFVAYFEENGGVYLEELSTEDRLKLLYIVLRIISNENSSIPPLPYKLGINKFAADSGAERKRLSATFYNETAVDEFGSQFGRFEASTNRELQDLPAAVNWVDEGAVTDVFDQGRCGSCWALSVMGAIEGAAAINPENKGFLQKLSIQQLISCDDNQLGCNGGNILYATGYSWKSPFGLASANDYPYSDYEGTTTEQCQTGDKNASVKIDNPVIVVTYSDILSREARVQTMKAALAIQPLSMALRSGCNTFSNYQSGIMTSDGACACEEVDCIDHAVLLVGYNDNSDPPYWLLKNSWGTGWGEGGYFRISQEGGGKWGLFGMLGEAVVPLVAFNVTGEEPEASDAVGRSMEWWIILATVVVSLVAW